MPVGHFGCFESHRKKFVIRSGNVLQDLVARIIVISPTKAKQQTLTLRRSNSFVLLYIVGLQPEPSTYFQLGEKYGSCKGVRNHRLIAKKL